MLHPTLYILTGLPYAGKSTLRNELVKRFGWTVVSIDKINEELGVDVDTITQADWDHTYTTAYYRLKTALTEGKNVIFDGGSLLFRERQAQRDIAQSVGAKSKLIYVNTPVEIIKERWLTNQDTKEREHVPEEIFEKALSMWEEPTNNESPILYNQSMDLSEWIAAHIEGNLHQPEAKN